MHVDDGPSDFRLEASTSTHKNTNSSFSNLTPPKESNNIVGTTTTAGIGSLTIPEFSSGVRTCLLEGNSNEIWGKVTDELAQYYTRKYLMRMKTTVDYQIVGKMIIKAYHV